MLKSRITHHKLECGTDEAGRGCLAGPVTAAAVILPKLFNNDVLNDSKQLSYKKRISLRSVIENEAVSFGVCHVFPNEIDKINILNASILAMHRAVDQLNNVHFIAVDGNRFKPYGTTPYETVVKGDAKYLHIAAASVLAKTYRDDYMDKIHEEFPMYNWKQNKGYPTKEHREALQKYGPTKYHRMSFKLWPQQLSFEF
ncbi:MAG: ribonuclease HII [Flavobacteriaceae bacterium]